VASSKQGTEDSRNRTVRRKSEALKRTARPNSGKRAPAYWKDAQLGEVSKPLQHSLAPTIRHQFARLVKE